MIAAWWLQAAVISTALAGAAWALEHVLAALGRARRWAWVAAMSATVALVVIGPFRQASDGRLATGDTVARGVAEQTGLGALRSWFSGVSVPDFDAPLLAAWSALTILAIGVGLLSLRRMVRRVRHGTRIVVQGTAVRVSQDDGPMIVGIRAPEIVVPRSLLLRDAREVRLVLAHEREHLAARDPWLLLMAALMVAVLPGLPALWWMRARLRLAIEIDCDARVLARGRAPVATYGQLLLALASRRAITGPVPLGLSLHPSTLERRIVAMTTRPTRRRLPLLVLPLTIGVMVACNAPLPTTEQDAPGTRTAAPHTMLMRDSVPVEEHEVVLGTPLRGKLMLDQSVPTRELVEREVDSIFTVQLDASPRRPLLLKEVEGRPIQ